MAETKVGSKELFEGDPFEPLRIGIKLYDELIAKQKEHLANSGKAAKNSPFASGGKAELGDIEKEILLNKESKKLYDDLDRAKTKRAQKSQQLTLEMAAERLAIQQTNAALKNRVKEEQAAEGSINKMRAELTRLTKHYDKLSEAQRNAFIGQQTQAKIARMTDELKKLEGQTGRNQRNVGNYSEAVGILKKEFIDITAKLDQLRKAENADAAVVEQLTKQHKQLDTILNGQAAGFVNMKAEIQANEKAIESLISTYGEESAVVQHLITENGKLRDTHKDLVETQKVRGSDTFVLDGMIESANALAGAYGIAQAATSLFGEENEELQKQMVKLQAVMTIINSLTAIQKALQKEGAAVQLLMAIRTKAVSAALIFQTFVMNGTTLAAKALRVALLATGIGAIVVLLTTAASAMNLFGDETKETAGETRDLAGEFENLRQEIQKTAEAIQRAHEIGGGGLVGINNLKRELALLQAKGASEQTIFKKKLQILEAEKAAIIARQKVAVDDAVLSQKLEQDLLDKKNEIEVLKLEFARNIREQDKKEREEDYKQQKKEFLEFQADLLELQEQAKKDQADAELKEWEELHNELAKLEAQNEADEWERNRRAEERAKERLALQQKIASELNKALEAEKKSLEENTNKKIAAIDKEIDARKKQADFLRAQAIAGNKDTEASITIEEKRIEDLEAKRAKAAEKARKQQLYIAAVQGYTAKVQSGDKNAVTSELLDLSLLIAGLELLPKFYEGTEHVGKSLGMPLLPGKDGHLVRVDGSERIMPGDNNALLNGMSNDEVTMRAVLSKAMDSNVPRVNEFGQLEGSGFWELKEELAAIRENTAQWKQETINWNKITGYLEQEIRQQGKVTVNHYRRRII